MYKFILPSFLIISFIYANSAWDLEEKAPLTISLQQSSADGLASATLYASTVILEGEHTRQYIEIITRDKKSWISNVSGFFTITKIMFIDNVHLLIVKSSDTATMSSIFNTQNSKEKNIGGGSAECIASGKNKGLILLHDSKGYFPRGGAFWVDKVVDKNGDLIEVLSKPKNEWGCIALNSILDTGRRYQKLRQSMNDCVYIDR